MFFVKITKIRKRKGYTMNTLSKRLISLLLAIIMTISMAFSLSSCGLFNFSIEDLLQQEENESNENSGGNSQSPNYSNPNFYPGSGSASLENVSAKNRTLLSTVSILSNFITGPSAGSGVIYKIDKTSGSAYIATNYHVVYNGSTANSVEVYLYGMESKQYAIPATVIGGSVSNDIAVLKITNSLVLKNSYAIAATLADSENVRIFDTVWAVGNPGGYGLAASEGIVNLESQDLDVAGADGSIITLRVIKTDAPVNPGNSGGGLYNENGELIGIVSAKLTGEDVDSCGFAIPSNLAKNLIDNIIDNCDGLLKTKVCRPLVGITVTAASQGVVIEPSTGAISHKQLVSISSITPSCVVKDRIAVGDIINSITIENVTTKVYQTYHVPDTMLSARVGDTVTLNLSRGGNNCTVSFTITQDMINEVD